ncbi:hypothetical protein [Hymenobacter chitinivorans]|uniref:Uncharacterized protein n=1 Tax=Hymenobacter chitinivorans DSM 11115 TaxID=1121954 RepID=A0A2M9ASC1_9BACT|nr:hypothetical protein [Hymenobacter chitinivorans]PJJ48567.1 hypothetical protein CLV45_4276 [Hymenobacter chitinivorans DSM 11115]
MSHSVTFYVLLLLCLLLGLGLTVAALRRPNRQHLLLRLVAGGLAVLGLWATAFPPHHHVPGTSGEAVLLTPGYHPDSLRQVLRRLGPATAVWRLGFTTASDTPTLPSLLLLREQCPGLRRLHVLGQGMLPEELANLGPLQLVLHENGPFTGFQQAVWSRQLELGQPLRVAGTFAPGPAAAAPVWISLHGAGRPTDSVRLGPGQTAFQLWVTPKATGPTVYQLRARRAGKLVATEPVPLEVTAPQPLRLLLLSSTASFEFKFLKNYLGAQQHRVALRTGISRGLLQTEFLNQPTHDLNRLTSNTLARYDAVITDGAVLSALSATESQALATAVRTTGLGLLVLADAAALPRPLPARASFAVVPRVAGSTDRPLPIQWPDAPAVAQALVPATLRPAPTAQVLVTDHQRHALVATQRTGLGFVTVSVVAQTFPWFLQGATAIYGSYWSQLLQATARPQPPQAYWQLLTPYPRPDQPVQLRLTAATAPVSTTVASGASSMAVTVLALEQQAELPEWHVGKFWPRAVGWHQARVAGPRPFSFYVFALNDWLGPELARRQQAAAHFYTTLGAGAAAPVTTTEQPYPAIWFFGLFILGASFLWLEEKL